MQLDMQLQGWAFVESLYEKSVESYGAPVEMRLFDPQFSEHLDESWLCQAVEQYGISAGEIHSMIADGLLKMWPGPSNGRNFILYSEKQAEVIKQMLANPRYTKEEVCHIVDVWNSFLEVIVMQEPPYDDMAVSQYEHFRRRSQEMVEVFESKTDYSDANGDPLGPGKLDELLLDQMEKLKQWKVIRDFVNDQNEEELPIGFQKTWKKLLFHLRFVDEFVRIQTADRMVAQMERGYSPEIEFDGFMTHGGVVELTDLNWRYTLSRFRQSHIEGARFPLRTPDFNLTERGLELIGQPSPAEYGSLFTKYRLDQLFLQLGKMGNDLWNLSPTIGTVKCPECGEMFVRSVSTQIYCPGPCKNRAKSRRWRERDPERARRAQAKYYMTAYAGELDDEGDKT